MVDSPGLIVSGSGSVAVSTDAMLADAVSLHTLALALPTVAIGLRHIESMAGQSEAVALGSWRVREAAAGIGLAGRQLDAAIHECGRVADSLDAAALAAGRAEQELTDRFVAIAEDAAARAGAVVGDLVHGNPSFARLLAYLAVSSLRRMLGGSIAPGDAELPTGVNEFLSDEGVVRLIRALVMTIDDFGGGIVDIPASMRDSMSDVGIGAVLLMAMGSLSGLFDGTPVSTSPVGATWATTPPTGVADRGTRTPNPVDGAKPQVRIEKYSAPGMPDRFEIYIGGTVDFSPLVGAEAFDTTSNLEMMAGLPAGSYDGVVQAMKQAGIDADSHIVITGHSQGALIAAKLAESGDYTIDGLVLFGSPSGQVQIPSSVPTLVVEHFEDPVVALGGLQQNVDATIVQAHAFPPGTPLLDGVALPGHHLDAYLETAKAIDQRATSPDIVAFRELLEDRTADYEVGEAQRYRVKRVQP